jgi:hypothetical protein
MPPTIIEYVIQTPKYTQTLPEGTSELTALTTLEHIRFSTPDATLYKRTVTIERLT